MKKAIIVLAFFIFMAAKTSADTHEGVHPVLNFSSEEISESFENAYINVVPEETKFPEHAQKAKFQKALSLLEEVLNSEEFKIKVITYVRSNGKREYSRNILWGEGQPLTNEQIYSIIMNGDEKMRANTHGEMNLNALVRACKMHEMASPWCRTVVGSTSPLRSKWIELNWKFYSSFETHEMVANIVHEWLHLIGFLHGKENLHEEVPYVVGAIAGQIAKKLAEPAESLPQL